MVCDVAHALHQLHSIKLVHWDVRMPNIVKLVAEPHYMLIDLELVAKVSGSACPL